MEITKESETLYIPLYAKALVSRKGRLLRDKKAQEIVRDSGYPFQKLHVPRGLQLYMGIRAAFLDQYAERFLSVHPEAVVLHLGCGLDSRVERVQRHARLWYDLDLPAVIKERRKYYRETDRKQMLACSVTDLTWLDCVDAEKSPVLVIAEGLTMYLTEEEIRALVLELQKRFAYTEFVFDAYSLWSVKVSSKHNPVNKMGAAIRWGLDDPHTIEAFGKGITHLETKYFTEPEQLALLAPGWRFLFRVLRAVPAANDLYRFYAFRLQKYC